jgi:hypothetical protein
MWKIVEVFVVLLKLKDLIHPLNEWYALFFCNRKSRFWTVWVQKIDWKATLKNGLRRDVFRWWGIKLTVDVNGSELSVKEKFESRWEFIVWLSLARKLDSLFEFFTWDLTILEANMTRAVGSSYFQSINSCPLALPLIVDYQCIGGGNIYYILLRNYHVMLFVK